MDANALDHAVKFLGTTDDITTCDCCGRRNLKSTVALSIDGADALYYGVTCASRALSRPAKEIRSEARAADRARRDAEYATARAEADAEDRRWQSFLDERVPALASRDPRDLRANRFEQLRTLGGFTSARDLYNAVVGAS